MTKHREGSRKQKVHALFDAEGDSAAFTLGRKLKLKDSTLRTWLWRSEGVKDALEKNAKAKAKPKSKKVPTEAAVA